MRCGRQPEYQQLRACVSESGNRLSPVRPLAIRAPLFPRHFLAVAHQTRTLPASLDFLIQDTKLRELFRHEPTMTGVSSFALDRCRVSLRGTWPRNNTLPSFLFQFAA